MGTDAAGTKDKPDSYAHDESVTAVMHPEATAINREKGEDGDLSQ